MAKIGERIGTYEVTRLLGSGGMAMVYAARHTSIGTDHALKILLPNYASHPRTVERFRQEARAQFRMRHANIVQVTDFVDDGENLALVMDLVVGMTLAEAIRLRPGPWAVADVVAVMRPVLEAMTYAHREGLDGAAVVHRDLKPENVMLDLSGNRPWPGQPKVMDFGIAKVLGASNAATATNARLGTPGYMAPEQFKSAKDAGAPADVWALGVMLWQLLAGRLPVDPEDNFALLDLYRGATVIPLLTEVVARVPKGLSEAVAQALALDPADRFADAGPLLRAVEGGAVQRGGVDPGQEIQRSAEELVAPRLGLLEMPYGDGEPAGLRGSLKVQGDVGPSAAQLAWPGKLIAAAVVGIVAATFFLGFRASPSVAPPADSAVAPSPVSANVEAAAAVAGPPAAEETRSPVSAPAAQGPSPPSQGYALTGTIRARGAKITGSHELVFRTWTGSLELIDGKVEGGKLALEVMVASLEEEVAVRNAWVNKLEGHLKSPDFLDVEQYATARFVATQIKAGGDAAVSGSTHSISGNLTLRGVTKAVTFAATIRMQGRDIVATTAFKIRRKDFGIVYAGNADDLIGDDVALLMDLKATLP